MESAHRGRMPADQASSSSSAAPAQRDVARACERVCRVPCNLRVARQRATQQNAAVEGAVGIAHEEATEWGRGMDYHASKVAAIAAGLTAAAAHEAVAARIRATDEEARRTQEAIACKEAEVKALEEALAQESAKKEAEEMAHAEATAKAEEDAAKKEAIEAARRKVAEEKAKTEAELAALEAQKARLQQAREAEAARAREEAEVQAAAATAAAMEEAEAKLRRETPPGGSRVETLRKLFEGDASSRMTLDEADTGSSGSSGTTAHRRRKGKGKTPERPRRPTGGHPHDSDPFFTASDGDERGRRHRQVVAWTGGGGGDVPMEPEGEDEDPPPPYRSSESSVTETPRWGDMEEDDDMDFGITKRRPSSDPPRRPGGGPRSRPSASAPSLTAPSHHSAGRRNERVPPGSGSEEWRDEWLSAEYRNRRAPPRTPVRPRRPAPAPVPIPMAGGRYGGLRDEVPRGDVEWDVGEGEDLDLDLEEFDISPPRGVRREAAELSRRRRDEDAYREAVRREHFGSAYVEEPRRSHRGSMEEMDVAAVGVRWRGR